MIVEDFTSALELRKKLGHILDRVSKKKEHITIFRGSQALATLIPAEEHQKNCAEKNRLQSLESALEELKTWQQHNKTSLKELSKGNSTKLLRCLREEGR